ncbi:MAG: phosphonate C-P lyase system protein PhnH [Paracoccaceae bacterium]|nr:MAG: phosphonate C-P lyase system protein PhnH [Paracoccaceae bacterium]
MAGATLGGGFADPPHEAARAFRAAMEAMARPGRIERVAGALPPAPLSVAAGVLLLTLADPTTPVHLAPSHDTDEMRGWIAFHTGAPMAAPGQAVFAVGRLAALGAPERFPLGTPEYPDRSVTLIIEVDQLEPRGARLTGPGIRDHAWLSLPDPAPFAMNRSRFPLGFDAFLTCGDRLAAVPRSTRVEAA